MLNVALTLAAVALAPPVRGAERPPDAAAHASQNVAAWTTGTCPNDADPSDVTVTDARGHQYRNANARGTAWMDRHGRIVARRSGDRISARAPVWVFDWCE